MSKCPFWSTPKEKVECNSECPLLNADLEKNNTDRCIFCECSFDNNIDIKNIIKKEYDFMDFSMYDDEPKIKIGY